MINPLKYMAIWVICFIAIAISLIACELWNSRGANAVKDIVVEIGKVECVNELDSFDNEEAAKICDLTGDIASRILKSKIAGMNKVAARRGGYKKVYGE